MLIGAFVDHKEGAMRPGRMLAMIGAVVMLSAAMPTRWAWCEMAGHDMADMVKNAKTAADHEALAAMYDKEAADAKARAAEHRQMAQTYKSNTGRGTGASAMPQHCASLAKSFDEEAAMYEKMAATERAEAKGAK
jgi:hypothetical protein